MLIRMGILGLHYVPKPNHRIKLGIVVHTPDETIEKQKQENNLRSPWVMKKDFIYKSIQNQSQANWAHQMFLHI